MEMTKKSLRSICLFCGSSPGMDPAFKLAAAALGITFAHSNIRLIYGGGHVGLMGVAADACLAAGGEVVGVIPRKLMEKEVGHAGLTQMHVVETMHERKALMTQLSGGFIALPSNVCRTVVPHTNIGEAIDEIQLPMAISWGSFPASAMLMVPALLGPLGSTSMEHALMNSGPGHLKSMIF